MLERLPGPPLVLLGPNGVGDVARDPVVVDREEEPNRAGALVAMGRLLLLGG
jgi:hypothetical protein